MLEIEIKDHCGDRDNQPRCRGHQSLANVTGQDFRFSHPTGGNVLKGLDHATDCTQQTNHWRNAANDG